MGVREMKHAAKLQAWSEKVVECRTSGKGVKTWCAEQGVSTKTYYHWEKQVVLKATQQNKLPAPVQEGTLIRIEPGMLSGGEADSIGNGIMIRHGESVVTLPAESSVEAVACLVKALNRHA